jgi:hypothetical protein
MRGIAALALALALGGCAALPAAGAGAGASALAILLSVNTDSKLVLTAVQPITAMWYASQLARSTRRSPSPS